MLTQTIGELLPSAIGVALSPVPIIAVILMLGTPKARVNGTAFAVGWVAGLVIVSVIVLVLTGGADDADGDTSTAVSWFKVAAGLLLLAGAVKKWRTRPHKGDEPEMPAWMATIDSFSPAKSLGMGAMLSGVNPKNLALVAAASATISQAGLSSGQDAVAVAALVVIGSATVLGPVVFYLAASDRAAGPLAATKDFLAEHNAVIMMVLMLILGAKILGQGLGGLAA